MIAPMYPWWKVDQPSMHRLAQEGFSLARVAFTFSNPFL